MTVLRIPVCLLLAAGALLLSACAGNPPAPAPQLVGRIWDVRAQRFIDEGELLARAARSRLVLLGEIHDNPRHHELQLRVLQGLAARGVRPALAMEQFDTDHQAALASAQREGTRDPERLADAGRLDRRGWGWPLYRDLIAYAAEQRWPVVAANLSREAARDIALGRRPARLPPATPAVTRALEEALVRGHCGLRPPPALLERMVDAQRARDARMAAALASAAEAAGTVVLIAGAGHVRRAHAVPAYLPQALQADLLSVAFVETGAEGGSPADHDLTGHDLVWFTPTHPREDPCAQPLPGVAGGNAGGRGPAADPRNSASP